MDVGGYALHEPMDMSAWNTWDVRVLLQSPLQPIHVWGQNDRDTIPCLLAEASGPPLPPGGAAMQRDGWCQTRLLAACVN
eukprot:365625-Chlamydomonas_euryale.AAC.14